MDGETIPATLTKLAVPIDGLVPYGRNPREGDVDLIVESLETHGQYRPIVVRAGTNEVLAGNHTLAAAKRLGWRRIAATFVDVDDDQAARIVLVDNRTADRAAYDNAALVALLEGLPDLDGTGYDAETVEALIRDLGTPDGDAWSDAFDAVPEGDKEFATRSFYMRTEQAEIVDRALTMAAETIDPGDIDGSRSTAALVAVCEAYIRAGVAS